MLPAKVYVLEFFEDPKKPLDMPTTSDPLSLLNDLNCFEIAILSFTNHLVTLKATE
jgi:hypothetical protein